MRILFLLLILVSCGKNTSGSKNSPDASNVTTGHKDPVFSIYASGIFKTLWDDGSMTEVTNPEARLDIQLVSPVYWVSNTLAASGTRAEVVQWVSNKVGDNTLGTCELYPNGGVSCSIPH